MSDRIDRDVINALIAGHFADPLNRKPGANSQNWSVSTHGDSLAVSFRDVRIFSAISWLLSGMVSKT